MIVLPVTVTALLNVNVLALVTAAVPIVAASLNVVVDTPLVISKLPPIVAVSLNVTVEALAVTFPPAVTALLKTTTDKNHTITYYSGAVWNKAGSITNATMWNDYVINFKQQLSTSLEIKVAKK